MGTSPGLLTDRYELTMLVLAGRPTACAAPPGGLRVLRPPAAAEGRRYGVLAGLGRLLPLIDRLHASTPTRSPGCSRRAPSPRTCADFLADFRFRGDVDAYREGDALLPQQPGAHGAAARSPSAWCSRRWCSASSTTTARSPPPPRAWSALPRAGRSSRWEPRRTHERAAIADARSAYIAGFASTSNLAAGRLYGVPTVGTAAHAFTLSYADEEQAFAAQVRALGAGHDAAGRHLRHRAGHPHRHRRRGPGLGAIRIDSGDLADESRRARALLDALGATKTRIIVTSDLDEYVITALADAPIDGFGVGTRLATGSGHPTA